MTERGVGRHPFLAQSTTPMSDGGSRTVDHRHMTRALDLARRGLYSTDPNPRVGCVLAHGERIVGEGWHRSAGEAHAEVHAIAAAGDDAAGATAYVTLEPCRHTGRTGPCTRALIEARVVRVVAAMRDPDPRVAGRGLAELVAAGIEVEAGLLEAQARHLNRGFISRIERSRPWVRCKLAATLDGRTATATGESRWITGAAARTDVHRLRAQAGAVLTGIGTLLADDPRLDARVENADCLAPPLRVIVDSRLRTPPTARVFSAPGGILIATARCTTESRPTLEADAEVVSPPDASAPAAKTRGRRSETEGAEAVSLPDPDDAGTARRQRLEAEGAEVVSLPDHGGRVALDALMSILAERGVNEVHTECGPTLSGALLQSALVDEVVVYLAPALLGDAARGMFTLPAVAAMGDRTRLEITGVARIGADLRIDAIPRAGPHIDPRAEARTEPCVAAVSRTEPGAAPRAGTSVIGSR